MNIVIREERVEDFHKAEEVAERSFYNVYMPGCEEHLLLHDLRNDPSFRPSLSRIATIGDAVVGGIYYEVGRYIHDGIDEEMLSFGPLFVDPTHQREGIGKRLVRETIKLAIKAGFKAIIITGVPTYYPALGFKSCYELDIHAENGEQFPALMGLSLAGDYFSSRSGGRFIEPSIMTNRKSQEEIDAFDALFPPLKKEVRPGQWKPSNPHR